VKGKMEEIEMRLLLILRGAPGSGKTTWVKENRLISYTLSFDNVRMLYKSPIQTIYGKESSDRKKDYYILDRFLEILEERMKSGELTLIDAVNSKSIDVNRYLELAVKYRYKSYLIDFTDIPIHTAKERNQNRMARKRVPEHIIDRIYEDFESNKIRNIEIIKPEKIEEIWPRSVDLSKYKRIHHIGDIHGCFNALKKAVNDNGNFNEDEFYIFLGDYTDRGPNSKKVIEFILNLKNKSNVVFCEGNHERWIWNWANCIEEYPEEFQKNTKIQLDNSNLNKEEVQQLYRGMKECFYYCYKGKEILTCHGGIASIPDNLAKISANQFIHGVGLYCDLNQIAKTFYDSSENKKMEIFGHRNPENLQMKLNDAVYCLEGGVENGGCLRWLTIENNEIFEKSYKNK